MLERPLSAMMQKTWRDARESQDFISFSDIVSFIKEYIKPISVFMVFGLLASIFYISTSDKIYSARTQILIEPKIPRNLQQQPTEINLSLDTAQVESQLAVLRSQKIARMVIDDLGLSTNPVFRNLHGPSIGERLTRAWTGVASAAGISGRPGYMALVHWLDRVLASLHPNPDTDPMTDAERQRFAVEIFDDSLGVQRVGVSYAIDISFESLDPELAARIANATADAFVRDQVETTTAMAGNRIAWLEKRMREVGELMNRATKIAQEFRAKHDYSIDADETPVHGEATPGDGAQQTTLEQLEVTAETYRKMYESLLASYTNSVDQQPYLIADARVITAATSPIVESRPRKKLVLAFGMLASLIAGIAFAIARRSLDRTVKRPQQIWTELGTHCLGALPRVGFRRAGFGRLDEVIREPVSSFAMSFKAAKAAMSLAASPQKLRSIGIISVSPGDGKSTVVSNLASLYGASGATVLVINADQKSALSAELLSSPEFDAPITESADSKDVAQRIRYVDGMSFYALKNVGDYPDELAVPKCLEKIVKEAKSYDPVIVELPPFTAGAEALAACPLLDGIVIVAQWGETSLEQLADLHRTLKNIKSPVLGVLLTRVRFASNGGYERLATQASR
jgi:uncharacterized protein involved in exopolysaccharide biosynthesis/Mrp family chromosome partitioning ATPase